MTDNRWYTSDGQIIDQTSRPPIDRATADNIVEHLRAAGFGPDLRAQQVIAMAEEVGEFVGAARRYMGLARRTGTRADLEDELGDVVITAWVTASVFDVDLNEVIARKLGKILTRGWREPAPEPTPEPDPPKRLLTRNCGRGHEHATAFAAIECDYR